MSIKNDKLSERSIIKMVMPIVRRTNAALKHRRLVFAINFILIASAICLMYRYTSLHNVLIQELIDSTIIKREVDHCFYIKLRFHSHGDDCVKQARSDLVLLEDGKRLGPGHSIHATIRTNGKGAYSHWGDYLFFSSTDNSDPASNGRKYLVEYKRNEMKTLWIGLLLFFTALFYNIYVFFSAGIYRYARERIITRRNIFIFMLTILFPALLLILIELSFSFVIGKRITEFPSVFDENIGFIFKADTRFVYSGHKDMPFEFSTVQKSNSHGFLDRERTLDKKNGVYRIVILGDSFVEAVQVGMEDKLNIVLEKFLAENGFENVEVLAFGYSGMNTSNLWPFYNYSLRFSPDAVIIFQNGDLTRNHPDFNSMINKWNPKHPPRFYFEKDADGKTFPVDINPEWPSFAERRGQESRSIFSNPCEFSVALSEIVPRGSHFIKNIMGYRFLLAKSRAFNPEGINYPVSYDIMLYVNEMDSFVKSVYDYTEMAIMEYSRDTVHRNARLIVVQQPSRIYSILPDKNFEFGGLNFNRNNLDDRVSAICKSKGIPFLSLNAVFSQKENARLAFWEYDGHFNAVGHRWSAESIGKFIIENRMITEHSKIQESRKER